MNIRNSLIAAAAIAICWPAASALAFMRRRWPRTDKWAVIGGSAAVTVAGAYWFVERVFLGAA